MADWITWIIQVVAYGLICFLLKRELKQLDDRDKRLQERIDEVDRGTNQRIDSLQNEFNETMKELPFKYTMRDDFIRAVAGFDAKLDKILEQLNRNQNNT